MQLGDCGLDGLARVEDADGWPVVLVRDDATRAAVDRCLGRGVLTPVHDASTWTRTDWRPHGWATDHDLAGLRAVEPALLTSIAKTVASRPE
jgi:hypothetical protein